jgi:plasmid stability protein
MNIVKVRYFNNTTNELSPREYSYYAEEPLKVGDIVTVPIRDTTGKAQVSAIDVPEAEVERFKAAVKTIPAGAVITLEHQAAEEDLLDFHSKEDKPTPRRDIIRDAVDTENEKVAEELANDMAVIIRIKPETDLAVVKLTDEIIKLKVYAVSRSIKGDTDLTPVTDDLILISRLKKELREKQHEYCDPIEGHLDAVRKVFVDMVSILDETTAINKAKVTAYTDTQKAKVAEAERLNREALELARKQAEFSGTGEITVDLTEISAPAPVRKVSTSSGSISEAKAPSTWEIENEASYTA